MFGMSSLYISCNFNHAFRSCFVVALSPLFHHNHVCYLRFHGQRRMSGELFSLGYPRLGYKKFDSINNVDSMYSSSMLLYVVLKNKVYIHMNFVVEQIWCQLFNSRPWVWKTYSLVILVSLSTNIHCSFKFLSLKTLANHTRRVGQMEE